MVSDAGVIAVVEEWIRLQVGASGIRACNQHRLGFMGGRHCDSLEISCFFSKLILVEYYDSNSTFVSVASQDSSSLLWLSVGGRCGFMTPFAYRLFHVNLLPLSPLQRSSAGKHRSQVEKAGRKQLRKPQVFPQRIDVSTTSSKTIG